MDGEAKDKGEIVRLEAWPEVDGAALKLEIDRLRKARTEEMGTQAHAALIEMGAGAAPELLEKLGREKDTEAARRIRKVLETVTDARHTRLLAKLFEDKSIEVRIWCLERVAGFPDAGVRAAAEKAHLEADARKRDREPREVLAAALCCASSGSFTGFEALCDDAEKNWGEREAQLHVALSALRGEAATARVAKLLNEDSRKRKIAGLRLLSACGEGDAATDLVAPFLDNTDNSLRVGAINALRGIVDGDPPISNLSVFQAIEEANKWKARL